jgi:dipeptidyl aminopeptidase/acylaminoacyl peptidase
MSAVVTRALLLFTSLLFGAIACAAEPSSQARAAAHTQDAFQIDDYFRLKRVTELALSSDARWLAYAVETYSPESDTRTRRVYLRALTGNLTDNLPGNPAATALDELSAAHGLAWIPATHELAFLSERAGSSQVYSLDAATGKIVHRTQSADSVESFHFSPNGKSLAYTTRAAAAPGTSLYDQFRSGEQGILIDSATTSSHDFVNPHWQQMAKPPPLVLWTARKEQDAVRAPVPGEPSDSEDAFFWSSDSRYLSVNYVASDMAASQLSDERTSIGILEPKSGKFRVLAKAVPPSRGQPAIYFNGGEWIRGEGRVLIRRVTEIDPWVSSSHPDWTVAKIFEELPRHAAAWRAIEVYPRGLGFLPISASKILLENTMHGVHSLFVLKPDGTERSELVAGLDGSSSLFQFSGQFSDVAFVNESLTQPPEIYVRLNGEPLRRVTDLNGEVARKVRHGACEVSWESADGVTVKGWLLEPPGTRPERGWPLITHVHGGPAFPFPDAFAPYFAYWPYPLEVYAAHGMAVFMPNYRGTHSYGRKIASPTDKEPLDDVITGVQSLIASGVADATRLGISGHSHGAMLGPLVMARAKTFRASSFAEGVSNSVVMYELMSDDANREIHDPIVGASLYDSPQRYLDESPDLQFAGVSTASLFEAGSNTAAILMLGFPKAARRAGMPTEFIVYPQTGHNLAIPRLQREAAQRNLDWFNFWLNDREDPDPNPAQAQQYLRWRE